jgi:hypothetical protein
MLQLFTKINKTKYLQNELKCQAGRLGCRDKWFNYKWEEAQALMRVYLE